MAPNPKINAEGWEVTPSVSNEVKLPVMIDVPAGHFLMGKSDENINWCSSKNRIRRINGLTMKCLELFAAEQPQHRVSLPTFEIAKYPVTNA